MTYTITGLKKTFRSAAIAEAAARRNFPHLVWGKWQQGLNGRMCLVGKDPNREANDAIIIQAR